MRSLRRRPGGRRGQRLGVKRRRRPGVRRGTGVEVLEEEVGREEAVGR